MVAKSSSSRTERHFAAAGHEIAHAHVGDGDQVLLLLLLVRGFGRDDERRAAKRRGAPAGGLDGPLAGRAKPDHAHDVRADRCRRRPLPGAPAVKKVLHLSTSDHRKNLSNKLRIVSDRCLTRGLHPPWG